MALFKKKLEIVEATQWFKNGDHPEDGKETFLDAGGREYLKEGKVVRYYRNPFDDAQRVCRRCSITMHDHGWMETRKGIQVEFVCPGDWIVTAANGDRFPCKPDVFDKSYTLIVDNLPYHN